MVSIKPRYRRGKKAGYIKVTRKRKARKGIPPSKRTKIRRQRKAVKWLKHHEVKGGIGKNMDARQRTLNKLDDPKIAMRLHDQRNWTKWLNYTVAQEHQRPKVGMHVNVIPGVTTKSYNEAGDLI